MSLTPLYPRGLAFRPKVMVGNRQEDVKKEEELADKRLLAAVVASLDMKLDYNKIAYYHGTTLSIITSLLRPALVDASMLIRGTEVEAEQGPSSSVGPTAKAEFDPVPNNATYGMNIKRSRTHIGQLRIAGQSRDKMEVEGEIYKGVVMMSKRLEGFRIGREMVFKTRSALGKRRWEED